MYILNGTIYKMNEKTTLPLSQAFMFGYGLFETLKVEDGNIIFFDEHMNRLIEGAKILGLKLEEESADILKDCMKVIQFKELKCGVLKISLFRDIDGDSLLLTCRKNTYESEDYLRGFKTTFSQWKRNSHSLLVNVKTNNYLENILEKQKATEQGFDEVLFLNTDDFVAEGAVSNVFWVKDNTVYTPCASCGLLPGIAREKIIQCAINLGIDIRQGEFTKQQLMDADEVFITNSVMDVMPVTSIEDTDFELKKDSLTRRISEEYNLMIGKLYE